MEQEILQKQTDFGKLKVSVKSFVDTLRLLRLKGRFENAALDYDKKHPLILRSLENSFFTKLIILDSHERVLHHGIETTLSDVRSNFWIVKGRKAVKSVLRKCVHAVGIKEDHHYLQKLRTYLIIELIHYMLFNVQDLTTLDLCL